jgi:hypothetical protein
MMNAHIIQALSYNLDLLLCRCVNGDMPATMYNIMREDCERKIKRELNLTDKVN